MPASVPVPMTFRPALATDSEQNAGVRDPLNFLLKPPIAELRQSAVQSIGISAWTSLQFDVEVVDTDINGGSGHDNAVNNSRYTCQFAGWYEVGGGPAWAANATNRRGARWSVNGTQVTAGAIIMTVGASAVTLGLPAKHMHIYLNVGDYLELQVFQDTAGALNTAVATELGSSMSVRWVSN